MSAHEESTKAFNLPFRVPCSPPALRTPPIAYRTPPPTVSSISRSIPSPPLGARFPGDRIAWLPLVFPKPQIAPTIPEFLGEEISGNDLDHATVSNSESECLAMVMIEGTAEIIQKIDLTLVNAEERQSASIPVDGDMLAASLVAIDDSHEDDIEAHTEVIEQAGEVIREVEFEVEPLSPESPLNQVDSQPAAEVLWKELPLAGDSVVIKELAALIGIPGYEVLRDLIGLGIFSKTTDSISAEVAEEIGGNHGVRFVRHDPANAGEVAADFTDFPNTAATGGNIKFRIANGQQVCAGVWIRDSILGLGRILELHTHADESDRHRIWFVGQSEDGNVVDDHPLLPSTLGIIDKSMVPADILEAAPDIGLPSGSAY